MVALGNDGAGILPPTIGVNPAKRRIVRPREEILQRDFVRLGSVEDKDPAYGIISSQSDRPSPGSAGSALATIRTASARARSRIAVGTSGA